MFSNRRGGRTLWPSPWRKNTKLRIPLQKRPPEKPRHQYTLGPMQSTALGALVVHTAGDAIVL
jgi:hypothetical protein